MTDAYTERLNLRQNGQVDSKNHNFSRKILKKLISAITSGYMVNGEIPYVE